MVFFDRDKKLHYLRILDPSYDKLSFEEDPQRLRLEDLAGWTELRASFAELNALPATIGWCKNLKELYLQGNNLTSLPISLCYAKNLTVLDICANSLYEFPLSICNNENLETIYLSGNHLHNIPPDVSKLTKLKRLCLSDNQFTIFPEEVCNIPNLEVLYLWRNILSSLPEATTNLSKLKTLDISRNSFLEFPTPVCFLQSIESLNISGNRIEVIPNDISKLTNMLIFDIRWTGVTKLPSSMSQLTQLKSLLLEEDSMVRPPATICQHGTDAILQYLFALLETRASKACILQLNFLGEVARGKTSLSRTLQSGTPSLTSSVDRTSVVEQGTWNPEDHIRFNINDFGGHQSYRVGHPLFISEAGVVCIVFNTLQYDPLSEEDFTNNIGDWIDMIQSRYPGIDLVVLGTHVDRCDEVKVDEIRCSIQRRMQAQAEKKQMLLDQQIEHLEEQISRNRRCDLPFLEAYRDKYENLKSLRECTKNKTHPIFMVSSQTLLGFGDLEIYLIKLAEAKKVELPKRWLDLASTILKDSGNLLTIDYDYLRQKFMKLNDVTIDLAPTNASSEFNNVMCFLASSGEIIWFEKHPALKNTIFHRQRLLADLLRVVLDHNNYARVNFFLQEGLITQMEMDDYTLRGIVSRNLLKNLWKTFNLNHFDIDTMTELLKSLELCYEVPCKSIMSKDSAYHFPCLLTEGKPEHLSTKWPHEISHEKHQLSLRFQFHHGCPCGVYEKFSVRLHRHLGLFKLRRVDWKDGLYAELGANSILVLRQQRGRECTITISVRGKKIPQLWEHLLNAHNDLLKIQTRDWPGLHFTKHLICPHCERLCLPNPSVFPGEILDLERPSNETRGFYSTVPCDNAVPDRCIPASMVIPAMAEFAPMAEYNKAALRAHQKALVDDITEPCLRDVLLRFQQEGIFSEREVLTVKSRDSQRERNVIFLDILRTKEERAFYEFTRYLGANGQLHLSELLQL